MRMRMRRMGVGLAGLVAAVLAGCASGGAEAPAGRAVGPVAIEGDVVALAVDEGRVSAEVRAPAGPVYDALVHVLERLELPITAASTADRTLTAERERLRRTLGGERLSRYLSCGSGLSGQNADYYFIAMTLRVRVVPAARETSRLESSLIALATNPESGMSDQVPCASTGRLEGRIVAMIGQRLAEARQPRR